MRRVRTRMRRKTAFGLLPLAFGIAFGVLQANASVTNKPVYNPHTKSYFELVPVSFAEGDVGIAGSEPGMFWDSAQRGAQNRVFKGVQGRLAVLRDLPTTEWVETTFQPPQEIWIGLRYQCSIRQLQWSDGTYFKRGDWQIWDRHWYQGAGAPCQGGSGGTSTWAGVTLANTGNGVYWISWGDKKTFDNYLVEFPTGAP